MATQIGTPSVRGGRREESNVGYTEDFAMTDWSDSPWRQDDERANRTGLTEPGSTDEAAGNPHEYARRRPSNATERSTIERPMGVLDVAAVIINKMVGTGIFTVPGQVLVSTGDKKISLILWAMGGIWTAACLTVYLELGAQFPSNGGELIYLSRTLKPRLISTLACAAFFVMVGKGVANALAFARFVTVAALPNFSDGQALDPKVIKLLAVNIVSVVCLIHYFSTDLGRLLNKITAAYKLGLVIVVFASGFWATGVGLGREDDQPPTPDATSRLGAFVLVLYSYSGWENANYITGEIVVPQEGKKNALPVGAYVAVGIVTCSYILVASSYYAAFTYKEIATNLDLGIARNLGAVAFPQRGLALNVMFALSAFGNLLAVAYTSARVKRVVARQRFLPFWSFLEKDEQTPKGGLLLHWFFAVVFILATPVNSNGYNFVVGMDTYGQLVIVGFSTLGLALMLNKRVKKDDKILWETKTFLLRDRVLANLLFAIVILANILTLIVAALGYNDQNTTRDPLPGWLWPVVTSSIFGFGALYGLLIYASVWEVRGRTIGSRLGFELIPYRVRKDGNGTVPILDGVPIPDGALIPDGMVEALAEAKLDGTLCRLYAKPIKGRGRVAE